MRKITASKLKRIWVRMRRPISSAVAALFFIALDPAAADKLMSVCVCSFGSTFNASKVFRKAFYTR